MGTVVDADADAVSRGGASVARSCVQNCMGLRSMIHMWQILKHTSTRLRANLAGRGGKHSGRQARVSRGVGKEGGKMHAGVAHAWSPCTNE